MKKAGLITAGILLTLVLILFLPIPRGSYDDGGTREFTALTYKIVVWNKLVSLHDEAGAITDIDTYHNTSVFWYPDSRKTIGELWEIEQSRLD